MSRARPISTYSALLVVCISWSLGAAPAKAGILYPPLTDAQRATVESGRQVIVDVSAAGSPWATAIIYEKVPNQTPETCAAVYWDLEGQVSYQMPFGLLAMTRPVFLGYRGDWLSVQPTIRTADPVTQKSVDMTYTQINHASRQGTDYMLWSWSVTPPGPGTEALVSFVSLEGFPANSTPGDPPRDTILAYGISANFGGRPVDPIYFTLIGGVVHAHAVQMGRGATDVQRRTLRTATP